MKHGYVQYQGSGLRIKEQIMALLSNGVKIEDIYIDEPDIGTLSHSESTNWLTERQRLLAKLNPGDSVVVYDMMVLGWGVDDWMKAAKQILDAGSYIQFANEGKAINSFENDNTVDFLAALEKNAIEAVSRRNEETRQWHLQKLKGKRGAKLLKFRKPEAFALAKELVQDPALSLRDIARKTGLSKSSLQRYFPQGI